MQEARWGGSGSRTKQELHCMYHFLEEPLYENAKINQHCRKSTTVPVSLLILHHNQKRIVAYADNRYYEGSCELKQQDHIQSLLYDGETKIGQLVSSLHGNDYECSEKVGWSGQLVNLTANWFAFSDEKNTTKLGLNISLTFQFSSNLPTLSGFQLSIGKRNVNGITPDWHDVVFCFDDEVTTSNKQLSTKFFYDCYDSLSNMVIKPRDKFKINTFVFTSQSDYDISELFVEVEAPNCTDNITHELSDCYHLYDKRIKSSLETDCAKNTFTYSYNVPHVYGSSVLIRLQCFSGNTSKSSRIVYSNKPLRLTISLNTVDFQWRGRCKVRLYAVRQSVEEPLLLKTHLYEKQCTASAEIPFWVLAVILVLFSLLILLGLTYLILKRLQPPKKLQNKKYIPSCTGTGTSCSLLQKNNYLTSNLSHSSVISQKVKKRTRVALLHFYKEEDILNLAHILQGKYGFDVVLDLWENNSIFPSYTDWIFNTVSTVDKIVVVWSEDASTAWRSRKSIIKKQEEDFFLTMLRVVQKRALLNQSLNMFFIVYFDQCQIQDIPSSFLQPPYNVFYLMEELQLLVYKLHPHRLSAT